MRGDTARASELTTPDQVAFTARRRLPKEPASAVPVTTEPAKILRRLLVVYLILHRLVFAVMLAAIVSYLLLLSAALLFQAIFCDVFVWLFSPAAPRAYLTPQLVRSLPKLQHLILPYYGPRLQSSRAHRRVGAPRSGRIG